MIRFLGLLETKMFILKLISLLNILITFLVQINCKKNILFIIIDDLRPSLSCYGDQTAITPNIDQIADTGHVFLNTFAQSLCGPSRTSLLTSRRPDSLHLYDVGSYWRQSVGNFTSLPQYFKQFGYFTQRIVSNHTDDYPISWSVPTFHGSTEKYKFSAVCPSNDGNLNTNIVCPVDVYQQPEQTLPDIQSTQFAIDFIRNYNTSEGIPFFLALGYHKPHIPLKFPKKYLDLYPISSIKLPKNRFMAKNLPEVAWNPWTDLRARHDIKQLNISFPYGIIPEFYQKYILQTYYACVSYIDDLIGNILSEINIKGLQKNTIIALIGDHGWSLGEHNEWAKYSNFDAALRVPFIISVPNENNVFNYMNPFNKSWKSEKKTKIIKELVELVDVFPTLTQLAGLPVPPICKEESAQLICTEGVSAKPLISYGLRYRPKWKSFVFSQYPRPSLKPQYNSDQPVLKDIKIMGYSMKGSHLRYTEWIGFDPKNFRHNWSQVFQRELYLDEQQNHNYAEEIHFQKLIQYLSKLLRKGWRYQLPDQTQINSTGIS